MLYKVFTFMTPKTRREAYKICLDTINSWDFLSISGHSTDNIVYCAQEDFFHRWNLIVGTGSLSFMKSHLRQLYVFHLLGYRLEGLSCHYFLWPLALDQYGAGRFKYVRPLLPTLPTAHVITFRSTCYFSFVEGSTNSKNEGT